MIKNLFLKLSPHRLEGDIFNRCLEYACVRNKFTIEEMQIDLDLDSDEVKMLLREHILKNYFPEISSGKERSAIKSVRMLSLYGRGVYFNYKNTQESLRMSQIAYYVAVAAFIASMVGAVAELLDLAVVDSVRIEEISEDLID